VCSSDCVVRRRGEPGSRWVNSMASIQVIPVGPLRRYVNGQQILHLEDWAGRVVREMIENLGIPSVIVGAVLVNGQLVQKDHLLQDGQEVKLIPLLGGG